MKPFDRVGFRDWREWVVANARGRVLEVGIGTGLNLPYFDASAEVVGFDPDRDMLAEIQQPDDGQGRIALVQASAEELPFPTEFFDGAVGTLVFCTIPNPERALTEVKRVLKPGGSLRLVEHVRARHPVLGTIMDGATPLWKHMAGGCHLNRNTLDTVRSTGFEIVSVQRKWRGLLLGIDAVKL